MLYVVITMTSDLFNSHYSAPSKKDSQLAKTTSTLLARRGRGEVKLKVAGQAEAIPLPLSVVELLQYILNETAQGNPVTLLSLESELTTQQAADMLNVSRPFFVKLLNEKKLPYRKVGSHRRVLLKDVLVYKDHMDKERRQALRELVEEAQELNMGY
jgi:excisionase family DNA binding protein